MPSQSQNKKRGFTDDELNLEEIQITITGRKTGKAITLPVWFIANQKEGKLFLLPMHGTSSVWFKNLVKKPDIQISLGEKHISVQANPTNDIDRVREVTEEFRQKYGTDQVRRYYDNLNVVVEIRY